MEDDDDYVVEDEDGSPSRPAVRPNNQYLARVITGLQRTNERIIDTNQSRAILKSVGASGAASLRLVLQRAGRKGPASVRTAALLAAQQQKLTLCTSLLNEVALSFGFKLKVHGPSGSLVSGRQAASHSNAEAEGEDLVMHEGEQGPWPRMQKTDAPRPPSPQHLGLQDLEVGLHAATTAGAWEEGEGEGLSPTHRGRGSAVLPSSGGRKAHGSGVTVTTAVRPKLALGALSSLGLVLRGAPSVTPGSALQAARRRALLACRTDLNEGGAAEGCPAGPGVEGDADAEMSAAPQPQAVQALVPMNTAPPVEGKSGRSIVWELNPSDSEAGPRSSVKQGAGGGNQSATTTPAPAGALPTSTSRPGSAGPVGGAGPKGFQTPQLRSSTPTIDGSALGAGVAAMAGKRASSAALSGLFSHAMKDIKRVREG